jgi:hypothetical protein
MGAEMSLRFALGALFALAAYTGFATVEALRAPTKTAITPDDVPKTCPITKPPDPPFIPPAPYSAEVDPASFWFGTPRLWTLLRVDGTWKGLPHYAPDDPTFRQKLFWWRQGYKVKEEPQPKLRITGKRLDSSAPPALLADHASNGWQDPAQPFMVVGINLPTLGCWEIKGQYQGAELTYVVWVAE